MNKPVKGCFLKSTGDPVCIRCAVNFPLWTLQRIDEDDAWKLNGQRCCRCGGAFAESPEPTYTPSPQELERFRFLRWLIETGRVKVGE